MEGEETDAPFEWIISRVCEEFNCLPRQAMREILDDPAQMAFDVMELRAYARAKESLDRARSKEDVPKSPMVDKVFEVQHELMQRRNKT